MAWMTSLLGGDSKTSGGGLLASAQHSPASPDRCAAGHCGAGSVHRADDFETPRAIDE